MNLEPTIGLEPMTCPFQGIFCEFWRRAVRIELTGDRLVSRRF
jgi:hypothetical protein